MLHIVQGLLRRNVRHRCYDLRGAGRSGKVLRGDVRSADSHANQRSGRGVPSDMSSRGGASTSRSPSSKDGTSSSRSSCRKDGSSSLSSKASNRIRMTMGRRSHRRR